jgi:arginine exporter protein ArgO
VLAGTFNMASILRGRLDRTFKHLMCETIAGAAAAIALFFFSMAAYALISERYSPVIASLVLGGAYAVVALAAMVWLRILRREEANQDAAASTAQLLQDPLILSAGLEALRAVGSRKAAPLALLLAGVVIAVSRLSPRSKPSQSGSKTGG